MAITDFDKPFLKIEEWDVFKELEQHGVKVDPRMLTKDQQETLRRRIDEMKKVVRKILGVKAGA